MEMKNNKFYIFLLALLFLFPASPFFAQNRVVDNAGLLNDGEIYELERLTAQIASTYNFNLVIVTETDIGGVEPETYANNYFDKDYNGQDGCLFLQVTGSRDYWFSTSGRGIKILNSTAFDKLKSDVVKHLKEDAPAQAYTAFIRDWGIFLELDAEGKNYNFIRAYSTYMYIAAWVVSLIIALLALFNMKAKMDNVRPKTEADSFIVPGSLAFTKKNDTFLYTTVTKTKRESSSSSSGGSHGSHSGGSGHGGGGGKY